MSYGSDFIFSHMATQLFYGTMHHFLNDLRYALSNHSIISYILICSFVLFLQFLLCCSIFLSMYASNIILVFNYWGFKIHSLVVLDSLMILNVQSLLYYPCFYFSSEVQLFEFYLKKKKQLLTFLGGCHKLLRCASRSSQRQYTT